MAKKKAAPRKRRPADVNLLMHALGAESTKEPGPSKSDISRVMSALGRKGGKVGGTARANALTPERRKQIAVAAAKKRWQPAERTE